MRFDYKLDDIDNIAKELINSFKNKIVLFNGDMGSGKTTIISSIVNFLGANVKVSSPTFSIVNEYNVVDGSIYHFDFYRIKNSHEALDLGIYDYLNSGNWNFIEWGDKIQELLTEEYTTVNIKVISKEKRLLELKQ